MFAYAQTPPFVNDPFFTRGVSTATLKLLADPNRQKTRCPLLPLLSNAMSHFEPLPFHRHSGRRPRERRLRSSFLRKNHPTFTKAAQEMRSKRALHLSAYSDVLKGCLTSPTSSSPRTETWLLLRFNGRIGLCEGLSDEGAVKIPRHSEAIGQANGRRGCPQVTFCLTSTVSPFRFNATWELC